MGKLSETTVGWDAAAAVTDAYLAFVISVSNFMVPLTLDDAWVQVHMCSTGRGGCAWGTRHVGIDAYDALGS